MQRSMQENQPPAAKSKTNKYRSLSKPPTASFLSKGSSLVIGPMSAFGLEHSSTGLSTASVDITKTTTCRCVTYNPGVRIISKEEVALLPIRRYEGEVRLVESLIDLERALAELR